MGTPQVTGKEPPRFTGVAYTGFTHISGKTIPVFFDASRLQFPPAGSKKDSPREMLNSITREASLLQESLFQLGAMIEQRMIKIGDGKSLLAILVCPLQAATGGDTFKNPFTCLPAAAESLKEFISKYGEPAETEVWSGKVTREIDLDGVVSWWGEIGVAASKDGRITHILVRRAFGKK